MAWSAAVSVGHHLHHEAAVIARSPLLHVVHRPHRHPLVEPARRERVIQLIHGGGRPAFRVVGRHVLRGGRDVGGRRYRAPPVRRLRPQKLRPRRGVACSRLPGRRIGVICWVSRATSGVVCPAACTRTVLEQAEVLSSGWATCGPGAGTVCGRRPSRENRSDVP